MVAMQHYHLYGRLSLAKWRQQLYNLSGEIGMASLVKSALLGLGLVAGVSAAAAAQSVSSLPASSAPTQSAVTQPYGSTQSYYPKPGGSEQIAPQNDQATAGNTGSDYAPYSKGPGPKPN
jgi:hypothetical protein